MTHPTALVTGAASGLGLATSTAFIENGWKVVGVDLNEKEGLERFSALGEHATFLTADVTDEAQITAAIDQATGGGELRAAVNCAGLGWASRMITREGEAHPLDLYKKVIMVNLLGTFNVCRLAGLAMSHNTPDDQGQRGVLINTASVAAFEGQVGQVAYSASKGGVHAMTLPMARDYSSKGVRVNTIAPGLFETPMLAALPDAFKERLAAGVPQPKRLGSPKEYAALVTFIVNSPYLNGETIRLDGALRMAPR